MDDRRLRMYFAALLALSTKSARLPRTLARLLLDEVPVAFESLEDTRESSPGDPGAPRGPPLGHALPADALLTQALLTQALRQYRSRDIPDALPPKGQVLELREEAAARTSPLPCFLDSIEALFLWKRGTGWRRKGRNDARCTACSTIVGPFTHVRASTKFLLRALLTRHDFVRWLSRG
eukprot:CAMPEP_0174946018 /NCGR_PEP_ID=MMETSP1355-20121228/83032_1 /TAXON_ID=464990 /ORGANISM="Hemiselmis tepida, Strain CCMP443" /LENGTH=178 /DNA_ID=CAMNT_0016193423 /DNA_START=86 /DNA_END=624 /DNA_ORIENTATION=+